ncbi:MAG: hypothetical protein IT372_36620 [Polyangiaceae bacterium]|nr:hypothetical protein [Polyangiaceae bacterium]
MSRPTRVRNLSRSLGVAEDDLILWLEEHAPAAGEWHPADFLPQEIADRAQAALGRPAPRPEPVERRCAECAHRPAAPGVRIVPASADATCSACGGSVNKRAALDLVEAFRARGLRRLLVVGGGPGTAEDLRALLGDIDVRIVDGESHRNATQADSEIRWADVIAVWSSTILPHKVSKLYTDHRGGRDKLVTVPRRGVAALCKAVTDKVAGTATR